MGFSPEQAERFRLLELSLTNHTPTPETVEKIEYLRSLAKIGGEAIIGGGPLRRERSLALTHLEDAVMWAVKALIFDQLDQGPALRSDEVLPGIRAEEYGHTTEPERCDPENPCIAHSGDTILKSARRGQDTEMAVAAPGPDPYLAVRHRELDAEDAKQEQMIRLQALAQAEGRSAEDRVRNAQKILDFIKDGSL